MIFVAYAFLIITLLAYFRDATSPVPPRLEVPARVLGGFAGIGFAGVALALLRDGPPLVGTAVLLLLAMGASIYVLGLMRWRAADGFGLRRTGWFSIVAALAFPTTLSLLMPIACMLVLTLHSAAQRLTPLTRPSPPLRQ